MAEQSGQPTEEPTARRWEKAFEDGQLAFSSELMGALILLGAVCFFLMMGKWFFDSILISIRERLTFFDPMIEEPQTILLAIRRNLMEMGVACLGLMLPLMFIAMIAGALQTRFNLSMKPLEWKLSKASPQSGLKRLFSTRSLNQGGISILKAAGVIVASYHITVWRYGEIAQSGLHTFGHLIETGASICLEIALATAGIMVVVGLIDFGYQLWKQKKDLMMTKQDIRDENKDVEGDPQMKARMQKVRNEMSKKRTMAEVPRASVIITNPTHFAVPVRYAPEESKVPIVIAKGADFLAKEIIKVAKENGIAVVERKPVARYLYAKVDIGGEIPHEIYHAVAEVLNFIRRMNQAA